MINEQLLVHVMIDKKRFCHLLITVSIVYVIVDWLNLRRKIR